MNILPLLSGSSIQASWRRPRYDAIGGPNWVCQASLQLTHERMVSVFELNSCNSKIVEQEVERSSRIAILRKVYPTELIRELRDIRCELDLRAYHIAGPYGRYDSDFRDLSERLAVLTAQLGEVK